MTIMSSVFIRVSLKCVYFETYILYKSVFTELEFRNARI